MNSEPPENNEQNYSNMQKSAHEKQAKKPHDSNTTNENPKENIANRNENVQHKTPRQQPSADQPKTPTGGPHMVPQTHPPPEPTIIPGIYPIPTTQEPDESFSSPSLPTNNRFHLLQNTPNLQEINTSDTTFPNNENDNRKTSKTQHLKLNHNYDKNTKLIKKKKLTVQLQATSFCDNWKLK